MRIVFVLGALLLPCFAAAGAIDDMYQAMRAEHACLVEQAYASGFPGPLGSEQQSRAIEQCVVSGQGTHAWWVRSRQNRRLDPTQSEIDQALANLRSDAQSVFFPSLRARCNHLQDVAQCQERFRR